MAAYYTRAKARGEVEPEDLEQGDSASVTTTTIASTIPVGLQVESTGELESMATEMAGPVATQPQLLSEGGHASVGGRCISGSANSPLADPLDSAMASAADIQIIADSTLTTSTSGNKQVTSQQPPTTTEVTAAVFRSPTLISNWAIFLIA